MTATSVEKTAVIYPAVVVKVQGVKCRALLDTGAGSSYASAALLNSPLSTSSTPNRDDTGSGYQAT